MISDHAIIFFPTLCKWGGWVLKPSLIAEVFGKKSRDIYTDKIKAFTHAIFVISKVSWLVAFLF